MFEDFGLAGLTQFSGQEHLVYDGVDLVEVEDQIKLANVVEVLVQDLQIIKLELIAICAIREHS